MAKIVVIDGVKFISSDELIEAMMKRILAYVYGNDLVVCEGESDTFLIFETLLREIGDEEIQNRLRHKYVMDRFYKKRMLE